MSKPKSQLNIENNAASHRVPLSERINNIDKHMNEAEKGITDKDTIESILKALCNMQIEDALTVADYEQMKPEIECFEDEFMIFFKNRSLRFIDLIAMADLRVRDDLANEETFRKKGITELCDIKAFSLHALYRYFVLLIYSRFSLGKTNSIIEDFLKINFCALQDYLEERYAYQMWVNLSPQLLRKHPEETLRICDILAEIRSKTCALWNPICPLTDFAKDVRGAYRMFDMIFYAPFDMFLHREFLPEECDVYDYLMRVSYHNGNFVKHNKSIVKERRP